MEEYRESREEEEVRVSTTPKKKQSLSEKKNSLKKEKTP